MKVTLEVKPEIIANMMISAIESGDPVTTAARGGWCDGISLLKGKSTDDVWYADPKLWDSKFQIEVIEIDDEETGHETKHKVGPSGMVRGLGIMAAKYPDQFQLILDDNTDAPCADIFLQCILFGEEKYA